MRPPGRDTLKVQASQDFNPKVKFIRYFYEGADTLQLQESRDFNPKAKFIRDL